MPTRNEYNNICAEYPNVLIVGKENGLTNMYRTFDESAQFLRNLQCGTAYYNGNGKLGLTFNENDLPGDLELQYTGEGSWYFIREKNNTLDAVIIACSRKNGGYCVAAYNPISKKIVRFVSTEEGGEISREEIEDINLLDTVKAKYVKFCPKDPQTENILVESNGINRTGKYNKGIEYIRQQIQFSDNVSILDTVAPNLNSVQSFQHSLEIVKVMNLKLIRMEDKIRANFFCDGQYYADFRVTDPIYENEMEEENIECLTIPSADIVLSIPWKPYVKHGINWGYYKFVAAIYDLSD